MIRIINPTLHGVPRFTHKCGATPVARVNVGQGGTGKYSYRCACGSETYEFNTLPHAAQDMGFTEAS